MSMCVVAVVSAYLLFKKSLLNSVKLALVLILWSFLSVLIEVHPLIQRQQGATGLLL